MKISVIVPTLNEESYLEKILLNVMKQEGDYEVCVVDGGKHR
jgi:glycosyltransferase involved in cell wall biosynthesis